MIDLDTGVEEGLQVYQIFDLTPAQQRAYLVGGDLPKRVDLYPTYVRGDDTGLRVLDHDHPHGIKRGHMWGFVGDGLVHFFYAPDWKAKHSAELLRNFTGHLHGDAYAGYGAMLRDDDSGEPLIPEERRLGCGMHIRRNFEKLIKVNDARAAVVLGYFKGIYRVEAMCKDSGLSPEERHTRRQQSSLPIVDEMYEWIHKMHSSAIPGTQVHKSLSR